MKLWGFVALLVVVVALYVFTQEREERKERRVVIVVGGGLAGLSATIEAHKRGSIVFLLDKEENLGGNSAKASSGINGIHTPAQHNASVFDTKKSFLGDVLHSGHGLSDETLASLLVSRSTNAVKFLESFGINLSVLSQCGGHSHPRTHRCPPPQNKPPVNVGFAITSTLIKHLKSLPKDEIKILTKARVTRLLSNEGGDIVGVAYQDSESKEIEIKGNAVILTTGGYSWSSELLSKYAPHTVGLSTTNGPFATGDGIHLGLSAGAQLRLMDQVQVHPTCFVESTDIYSQRRFLAPEALRGSGGILLNHEGRRFVNELGLRDHVTAQIFTHCQEAELKEEKKEKNKKTPKVAHLLLSENAVEIFQAPNLGFYKFKKLVTVHSSPRDFAIANALEPEIVEQSIQHYIEAKNGERVDEFGKTTFPASFSLSGSLHTMMITPCIHYTMGGLSITPNAEVLNEKGEVIKGLLAAGEVTGGLHGANRLAGNSLLECTVFGRIAGERASSL